MPVRKKKPAAKQPVQDEVAIVERAQPEPQPEQPAAIVDSEVDFDEAAVNAKEKVESGDILDMFAGAGLSDHAVCVSNMFTTHGGGGMRAAYVEHRQRRPDPQQARDAQEAHERALNAGVRAAFPPRGTKHDDGKAQDKVAAQAGAQHSASTVDTMHGKLTDTRPRVRVS